MCCVPQAFQGPIKMEKLEYLVEARTQYVRVIGAETFVEDLAAFVPPQRARDVAKKSQSGKGVGAGMCVEKNKMPGTGAPSRQQRPAASRRVDLDRQGPRLGRDREITLARWPDQRSASAASRSMDLASHSDVVAAARSMRAVSVRSVQS